MAERQLKDQRVSVRLSQSQREIIDEAAAAADKDVSAFVLDAALLTAQRVLADRRAFALSEDDWQRFAELLDRPVAPLSAKPRLEELVRRASLLER